MPIRSPEGPATVVRGHTIVQELLHEEHVLLARMTLQGFDDPGQGGARGLIVANTNGYVRVQRCVIRGDDGDLVSRWGRDAVFVKRGD